MLWSLLCQRCSLLATANEDIFFGDRLLLIVVCCLNFDVILSRYVASICDLQHAMSVSILHRVIDNLVVLLHLLLLILGMLKMEYIESRGVCLWLRRYLPFTRKLIQQSKIDRLVSIVIITAVS